MFKNLTIIELASVLAGPSVGMFFAELGANVIKVENKKSGGDVTRQWKLPNESKDAKHSAYYCSVNWNKQTIFADLTDKEDQQKIYELAKTADIIITNFKAGADHKLGMDYETFKAINPQIIYGKITGFGDNEKRTAFDVVLQAETGFMYMNGAPNNPPVKMPVALIDLLAAHQLKEGILVALLKRQQTNKGSVVSVSLLESAIASLANQATNWLMADHIPQPMGSLHPNIAPYGEMFQTKDDKKIVLAIGNDKQFQNLCDLLNADDIKQDQRFVNNAQRVQNRTILAEKLAAFIQQQDRAELIDKAIEADVPMGGIRNMQEVFENPKAQQMILEQNMDDGTISKRVKTVVFKIQD